MGTKPKGGNGSRGRGDVSSQGRGGTKRSEQSHPDPLSKVPPTSLQPQTSSSKKIVWPIPQTQITGTPSANEATTSTAISRTSATSSVRQITHTMATVSLTESPTLPERPDFGSKGKLIHLISNFYTLQIPDRDIYRY
ncbi:hypothetical protein HK096_007549, partial [Nowakowskiella sp. JEL0078]